MAKETIEEKIAAIKLLREPKDREYDSIFGFGFMKRSKLTKLEKSKEEVKE